MSSSLPKASPAGHSRAQNTGDSRSRRATSCFIAAKYCSELLMLAPLWVTDACASLISSYMGASADGTRILKVSLKYVCKGAASCLLDKAASYSSLMSLRSIDRSLTSFV